jgi:hypothetical protein
MQFIQIVFTKLSGLIGFVIGRDPNSAYTYTKEGLFPTNPELDFTVVQLESPPRLRSSSVAAFITGGARQPSLHHSAPGRTFQEDLTAE